jgi:amidase
MKSQDWRTLAANHITHRDSKIPLTYLLPPSHPLPLDSTTLLHTLDPLDRLITSHDATSLALHVAARTYTAVRVVQAYARTAAIAQQATNCLTDYFVDEAMERARWLDEEMERRGGVVGPLHGVVISVKGENDAT